MQVNNTTNQSSFPNPLASDPGISAHSAPHLTFGGGRVLAAPKFASIYYGGYWGTDQGKSEAGYLDAFGNSVVKSKYTSIWSQYGVGDGKFLGSSFALDKGKSRISDTDVQKIVKDQIKNGAFKNGDDQTVYTVFLPPGKVLVASDGTSSLDGMGGYHGSFTGDDGKRVYYAAIVYSQDQNGIDFAGKPTDNITITASHEWSEAATDPDVNNGKLGWYDRNYGEIGDIPINIGMPLKDLYGRVNHYAVQKEWSNVDGRSELSAQKPG